MPAPSLEPGDAVAARREARAIERQRAWRARQAAAGEPPSRQEFELLAGLHRAQDLEGFAGLRAGRLVVESWERTYPEQENYSKVTFGGYIMRRAYELASICAERVAPGRPVVAAVNRVNFFEPVLIGDKLRFTASVVYTEGPAICVQTAIERHSRDRTARALSNSCLFTFANVTPQMTLAGVPPVHPATYGEDARWLDARRNLHDIVARLREGPWLGLTGGAGRRVGRGAGGSRLRPTGLRLPQRFVDPLVDLVPVGVGRFLPVLRESIDPLLQLGPAGALDLAMPLEEGGHVVDAADRDRRE